MTRPRLVPLVVILWFACSALFAQKTPPACPLLTTAEVSVAAGAKVAEGRELDLPIPGGNGLMMTGCHWVLGQKGAITIGVSPAATGANREQGLAKIHAAYDRLKAKGWKGEEKKIGNALCSSYAPPPKESDSAPVMVSCMGEAKGEAVIAYSLILHTPTPMEKVKALLDSALKRLP